MPGAIEGAVATFASWATGTFITATGSSSLLAAQIVYSTAYAVGYAAIAGASYAASSALAPKAPGPSDGQLSIQQPIPYRRRVYGRAKLGGYYSYFDSKNGDLYQLIAMVAHEIDAIEENWVSDRRVTIDASGWVKSVNYPPNAQTDQFNPKGLDWVRIITRLGAPGQTSSSVLQAAFPSIWTADHVGIGIADALLYQKGVTSERFGNTYPGGAQSYRGLIRGAKVVDPRVLVSPTTEAWSDNAVLVIRDYLTHQDGWRIDPGYFDSGLAAPITRAAADICDELVALKNGGTEKRYRLWGYYGFDEEPRNVLRRFLTSCAGYLQPQNDGTIAIKVGAWEAPTITISDPHILAYEIQHFQGEFDAVNEVRASFTDPDNDYQDTESWPWQDEADIARRGHIRPVQIDCRHSPSYRQTRRIQKIVMAESSSEWIINLTTDMSGIRARRQRFVTLSLDELGLTLTCRVTAFSVNTATGVCQIGLASFGSAAYDWTPASEEGDAPVSPPDTSSDGVIETPTGFIITVETRTVSGSVSGAVMVASCSPAALRSDLRVRFEYQVSGDTGWTVVFTDSDSLIGETGIVADGTYNWRASFLSAGNQSPYATVNNVVVSVAVAAPSAPTGLTATLSSPAVTVLLAFKAPNSASFHAARVWRNTVNVFGTATDISGAIFGSPNQDLSYTDTPGAGTFYYWATAESSTGAQSSPAGPVSVTL